MDHKDREPDHAHGQSVSVHRAAKVDREKLKPFCKGAIEFLPDGCIYIKDPALADAIQIAIAVHGGICIMREDPSRPTKDVNVVC